MPAASPSGPEEPASATTAAPEIATADQARKGSPGRSPNIGMASTPTTIGESVDISVVSTTEVIFTADMKQSW